jgi:hypothetical protein
MERREAQFVSFRFRHRVRSDGLPKAHRLAALHSRRFWARGPCFRMGRTNLIRSAFAAFIRIPCSRERQSHVVGPDGDPSLPDAPGANRACRRHILLRFKAPSRSAPHEQDMRTIFLDREMSRSSSFRGARLRANLESTATTGHDRDTDSHRMDSGPAPRGASRNDECENLIALSAKPSSPCGRPGSRARPSRMSAACRSGSRLHQTTHRARH